ncbi:MAG: ferrous iron transport protein B [Candidatus Marinimicrobia bacterium]|nr:ferrous iron transport protein B [Candidatus Neomarinimicrobiota bacterium]MCF7827571.1 ferrous iron transport protein B [Candidatus Neomarinimicrobiota bacterium]MCF7881567.1 ferrous iron transport protein B [Candidatus Neomarinimicrobiota bacterium]
MKIAVLGPPNVGKSTIYNAVAGYKSVSSNFSGTTIQYEKSTVRLNGMVAELIDFPGCYSLSPVDDISAEVSDFLITNSIDVIVSVVDAGHLERTLPLTLELLELGKPVVVALNMIDEARASGIEVDADVLSTTLDTPVIETVASKNIGVRDLFREVKSVYSRLETGRRKFPVYSSDVEEALKEIEKAIAGNYPEQPVHSRFVAVNLLERNTDLLRRIAGIHLNGLTEKIEEIRKNLSTGDRLPDTFMISERNAITCELAGSVTRRSESPPHWRDRLDNVFLHPRWGYVLLGLALAGVFYFVFGVGSYLEEPLLDGFQALEPVLVDQFPREGLIYTLLNGALAGISGGLAIVLPYLIPFFLILGFLEDVGYLPRVAFLMDTFMHKIGIHGTAIMPIVLGYGCTVPALFATRILPGKRDRIISAVIASLIPCSARTVIIFGLVAYYLGALAAIGIYLLNIVVIVLAGRFMSTLMPSITPGMIMEMPPYRLPSLSNLVKKVWFRIREFVIIAWPLLVAGSVALAVAQYYHWDSLFNIALSPLTGILGLPAVLGTTLIFGVLRKELSLIMLVQAIGTANVISVLSAGQILTFTVFVTFYIPCLATLAVLYKEFGIRWTLSIAGVTLGIATFLGIGTRLIFGG